ncbi:MAG: hypothetical protein CL676_01535 [Bdellovibrionaceae bacterium]|nr:hypothetical protein [Pseudobdellovibrionaceae bacterium]
MEKFNRFATLWIGRVQDTLSTPQGNRRDLLFFFLLLILGAVGVLITEPMLKTSTLALGRHTSSLFIPFVLSSLYYGYCNLANRRTWFNKGLTLFLFAALMAPLTPNFNRIVTHLDGDDSSETTDVAEYMVRNKTLYGVHLPKEKRQIPFEDLKASEQLPVFKLQYGLRYVLAGFMAAYGGQYRWIHASWLLLYLVTFVLVMDGIALRNSYPFVFWSSLIGVLSAPYACKILLMTMNEPFAVLAMAWFAIFFSHKKRGLAAIALALVPFFRQNMAIFSALTFLFVVRPRAIKEILLFVAMFLFPAWHNLYYSGKFAFFTNGSLEGVSQSKFLSVAGLHGVDAFIHNTLHYFGFCSLLSNLGSYVIAWLFVPLSTLVLLWILLSPKKDMWIKFLLIAGAAVGPSILFGSDTYPRFEYVNFICIFLAYSALFFQFQNREPKASSD